MKRQFEIHDDSGCICSGSEIDVSQVWMFLTKPPEVVDKLLTGKDIVEIAAKLPDRKYNGTLRLLRQISTHEKE